ncbi:MAG: RNA-directed DNA polymerase [Planctomycetes bacterium]|nr:RNA-directed DNA polymerase [Planctomycetota bacterium]
MGFFDWLFRRKKDDYSKGLQRGYQRPSSHPQPLPPQPATPPQRAGTPPEPAGWGSPPPPPPWKNRTHRSWINRRSRTPPEPQRSEPIPKGRPGELRHLGGTAKHPDPHFKPGRVQELGLPAIPHLDALATLLGTTISKVAGFAVRPPSTAMNWVHYFLHPVPKKSGGTRLLMVPCPELKRLQRRLHEVLVRKLPLHEAAHGFRARRDSLSNATAHAGKAVVICMDIADFFPSFDFRRVCGYLRWAGYGRGVAIALANLTTNSRNECKMRRKPDVQKGAGTLLSAWKCVPKHPDLLAGSLPELPQGSPTSPGLANAICRRMDKRLAALARKFGGAYTRYADDLTFSGGEEMSRRAGRLMQLARKVITSEGLAVNEKKTRVMRRGRHQRVTGVVVNEKPNLPRAEFDRLKAILTNCIRHGPASQNREQHADFRAHLHGCVAYAAHIAPARGGKLVKLFNEIRW